MNYRIPTVPLKGRPPKLTREQQERLLQWAQTRRTIGDWAGEFGVCKGTINEYIKGYHKFPVRA